MIKEKECRQRLKIEDHVDTELGSDQSKRCIGVYKSLG